MSLYNNIECVGTHNPKTPIDKRFLDLEEIADTLLREADKVTGMYFSAHEICRYRYRIRADFKVLLDKPRSRYVTDVNNQWSAESKSKEELYQWLLSSVNMLRKLLARYQEDIKGK